MNGLGHSADRYVPKASSDQESLSFVLGTTMLNAKNPAVWCGLCLCLLVLATGCGSELGRPTTVGGKITVEGQPLSGATVMLHCLGERRAELRTFRSTTDSSGQYRIDKVYPGTYDVVIVETAAPNAKDGMQNADPDQLIPADGGKMQVEVKSEKVVLDLSLKRQKAQR